MNHHWSVLLDQTSLQIDREAGINEREDGERGGVSDYLREVIIYISIYGGGGGGIILGWRLIEEGD